MQIYQHRDTITVAGGTNNTVSLKINGGLCQQLLIRALTDSTTQFRADLTDSNSIVRRHYAFHEGEINDSGMSFPLVGQYTINITNANQAETFDVILAVEE